VTTIRDIPSNFIVMEDIMSALDIIRAWKEENYRLALA